MTERRYRRLRVSAKLDGAEVAALELGVPLPAGADRLCGADGELDVARCRPAWERHRESILAERDAREWHGPAPTCWAARVFDEQPQVAGLRDDYARRMVEIVERCVRATV